MRAFVHIGATKTGTTSLQGFFDLNRAALSARGVRYWSSDAADGSSMSLVLPVSARVGRSVPPARARALVRMPLYGAQTARADAVMASLTDCVRTSAEPVFLASSEHLSAWLTDAQSIAALDDLLGEHFERVDYVYYIRHQQDLALSRYSQRVKSGLALTFDEMLDQSIEGLDHNAVVQTWLSVLDRERFHLRLLDATELVNGDLYDDFCQVLGIDAEGLARPERRNESMSAASIELARRVNALLPAVHADKSLNTQRVALVRQAGKLGQDLPKPGLTAAQAKRIDDAVAASNEALRKAFFPHRDTLFAPSRAVRAVDASAVVSEALDLAVRLAAQPIEARKPPQAAKRRAAPGGKMKPKGRRILEPNRTPDGA